ncbi:LysM peptidoglycan-binding domain-containing protein [Rhodococcus sp. X156]|uniref:LysM peptidoglycan-binding domain-containing protein n=1 Tax=Rhodococcus sp. X156 TaxID=2499145 RepID=UPI000FD74BE4|nr:LysM peptidoglycan-binding domain-containing protein [Rhodococcus sp. X156]
MLDLADRRSTLHRAGVRNAHPRLAGSRLTDSLLVDPRRRADLFELERELRSLGSLRAGDAGAARTVEAPRRTRRPREVARRRPAGRLVEYGTAPLRRTACTPRVTRPSPAQVRLRLVVTGAVLAGALALGVLAVVTLGGGGDAPMPTQTAVTQVRAGESLSAVAVRSAPGVPAAAMVQRIVDLNALDTVAVRPGQSLVVPVGG